MTNLWQIPFYKRDSTDRGPGQDLDDVIVAKIINDICLVLFIHENVFWFKQKEIIQKVVLSVGDFNPAHCP